MSNMAVSSLAKHCVGSCGAVVTASLPTRCGFVHHVMARHAVAWHVLIIVMHYAAIAGRVCNESDSGHLTVLPVESLHLF